MCISRNVWDEGSIPSHGTNAALSSPLPGLLLAYPVLDKRQRLSQLDPNKRRPPTHTKKHDATLPDIEASRDDTKATIRRGTTARPGGTITMSAPGPHDEQWPPQVPWNPAKTAFGSVLHPVHHGCLDACTRDLFVESPSLSQQRWRHIVARMAVVQTW